MDRPTILGIGRLMEVSLALGVEILKRPLNGDLSAIREAKLGGPRIKANLSDFEPGQELQLGSRREGMHVSLSPSRGCETNVRFPPLVAAKRAGFATDPPWRSKVDLLRDLQRVIHLDA